MNLLELCQEFTKRTGVPKPSAIVSSTDKQVMQIAALLNEVLDELVAGGLWQGCDKTATFTTLAQEDQGALTTIAPYGFKGIVKKTIYNRTLRLPFYGPMTPSEWQALKALPQTGPFYKYRIQGGRLLMNPTPPAGHSCAFEYYSNYAVLAADGSTYKRYPTADDDTFIIGDDIMLAGLRWKWKYEKGLEYAEDFRRFEELKASGYLREDTAPHLVLDGGLEDFKPGIFVPWGNWNGKT